MIHRILLTKKQFKAITREDEYNLSEGFCMVILGEIFNGKYYRLKVEAQGSTQLEVVNAFRHLGIIPYPRAKPGTARPPADPGAWKDHVVDYYPD
jgi:hypothetical protein